MRRLIVPLIIAVIGFLLVGYGLLPLTSSDMTAQNRLAGGAMLLAGLACLLFSCLSFRPKEWRFRR